MQLPLIILAFFAITAGFVGVPPEFPIFGAIFSPEHNPFFEFVSFALLPEIQPSEPEFNYLPVLVSFAVALGGLWLGYEMYGRKPLRAGEEDPLRRILNPAIYRTLENKYYLDELYTMMFVVPSQWFSRAVVAEFIDRGLIDGFLHLTGRVSTFTGDLLKVFNLWLIDGVGDGIPEGIGRFGSWFRQVQSGRVQQYLLYVTIGVVIIGLIFALSTGLLQATN
jgi:NADH-quinone oxidoreductase subunit L